MSYNEAEETTPRVVGGKAAALAGPSGAASGVAHIDELALLDMHFVGLVRGYEQLYMRDHPHYGDRQRRNDAWAEIGTIVDQPAEVCRKRWTRMRTNYYRYLDRAKTSTKEMEHRPGRPAYEKMMTFLNKKSVTRNKYNKLVKTVRESDKEESENEYVDHTSNDHNSLSEAVAPAESENEYVDHTSNDHNSLSEAVAPAPELQDSSEEDDVVDFFVELGESVKDLPEAVRIHVKREAFRIVTDAEEMLYHKKLEADPLMNTSE